MRPVSDICFSLCFFFFFFCQFLAAWGLCLVGRQLAVYGLLTEVASTGAESTGSRAGGLQQLCMGFVAPWHWGPSQTRDPTCIPCIGRLILNHWTSKEISCLFMYMITLILTVTTSVEEIKSQKCCVHLTSNLRNILSARHRNWKGAILSVFADRRKLGKPNM